jgi:hypothetical protein
MVSLMRPRIRPSSLVPLVMGLGAWGAACGFVTDLGPPRSYVARDATGDAEATDDALDDGRGGGFADVAGEHVILDSQADDTAPSDVDAADDATATPPVQASLVAVGPTQACAIVQGLAPISPDNNTVRCWGSNAYGELGNDPQINLTLGPRYAFAVVQGSLPGQGYLYGWGSVPFDSRVYRQSGGPSYAPSQIYLNASPLVGVVTASVGAGGGCCTLTDRSLLSWGAFASSGQGVVVLDGGVDDAGTASFAGEFQSVAVGRAHACGIATRGGVPDVECWGANGHGQAGVRFAPTVSTPTPVGLPAASGIVQVAVGGDSSCALLGDGSVTCWGANGRGQIGANQPTGQDAFSPTPVVLPNGAQAREIAVGDSHACALLDVGGTVACWGDNAAAQLGLGPASASSSATPLLVQTLRPLPRGGAKPFGTVRHIAAGGQTTCAIVFANPRAWCWGNNAAGQAGQPPSTAPLVLYATALAIW